MTRKLIILGLAALMGLAIASVASARWYNVIRGTRGDDTLVVLLQEIPEELREKVEDAVDGCPRAALKIEGDQPHAR